MEQTLLKSGAVFLLLFLVPCALGLEYGDLLDESAESAKSPKSVEPQGVELDDNALDENKLDDLQALTRHMRNFPSKKCHFNQDFFISSPRSPNSQNVYWYNGLANAGSRTSSITTNPANMQGVVRVKAPSVSSTVTITLNVFRPYGNLLHLANSPAAYGSSGTRFAEVMMAATYMNTFTKGTAAYQYFNDFMQKTGYATYKIVINRYHVQIYRMYPTSGRVSLYYSYMFVMNQYIYIGVNRRVKTGYHGAGVTHMCVDIS